MNRRLFVVVLFSLLTVSQLYGQRVISQMKPDPVDTNMNLHFAVNLCGITSSCTDAAGRPTNEDVPPNIIFTPDGHKGFVSYPTVIKTPPGSSPTIDPQPGKIVVFDPTATPDLLDDGTRRIKPTKLINAPTLDNGRGQPSQPGRPAQMSVTPDNKIIAVVSVLSNAIFLIDADRAELRTTFRFPNAQFGHGNKIVFAPDVQTDGYIAYISSSRQDSSLLPIEGEVIRFKIGMDFTVQELSPRVRVGIAPATLALSQDGQVMTVVNTLFKIERGQVTVPKKISIIDVPSFRVKAEVRPPSNQTYDFRFTNNVALTPDGKTGIVAMQASLTDPGRALIFNTDDGTVRTTVNLGFSPHAITLTPDNRFFGIVDSSSIFFINIAGILSADEATRNAAVRQYNAFGSFGTTANLVFPFDKTRAFISSTVGFSADRLISFDLGTGAVDTATTLGDDRVVDEPLSATVTPDGTIVAVVNFRAETVELVADSLNLDFPFVHNESSIFTQLSYLNPSSVAANDTRLMLTTSTGVPLVTAPPATAPSLMLAPGKQQAVLADQIFELSRDRSTMGWTTLSTDNPNLIGSFTFASLGGVNAMAGGLPVSRKASRRQVELIFPEFVRQREVMRDEDGQVVRDTERLLTQIHLVNPNYTTANVRLELIYRQVMDDMVQVAVATANGTIPGQTRLTRFLQELFPDQAQAEDFTGYLRVTSDIGLIGYELIIRDNRMTVTDGEEERIVGGFSTGGLNSVPRISLSNSPRVLYAPSVVSERNGSETYLNLINLPREIVRGSDGSVQEITGAEVNVRISLFSPNGTLVARLNDPIRLKAGEQLRKPLRALFDQIQSDSVTGWLQVELESATADDPNFNVLGDTTLAGPGFSFLDTAPLQEGGLSDIIFPQVVHNQPIDTRMPQTPDDPQPFITENFLTALAIVNPTADRAAVTVEVFTENGDRAATADISIEPRSQISRFLDQIIPTLMPQSGGYIRLRANPGVLAVMVLMAENLNGRDLFTIIPPQSTPR